MLSVSCWCWGDFAKSLANRCDGFHADPLTPRGLRHAAFARRRVSLQWALRHRDDATQDASSVTQTSSPLYPTGGALCVRHINVPDFVVGFGTKTQKGGGNIQSTLENFGNELTQICLTSHCADPSQFTNIFSSRLLKLSLSVVALLTSWYASGLTLCSHLCEALCLPVADTEALNVFLSDTFSGSVPGSGDLCSHAALRL